MKRCFTLALLALLLPMLLLPSCRRLRPQRDTMPQKVAYMTLTVEGATHSLGGKQFSSAGSRAEAAPVTYHMVMKDGVWYFEESCVKPAAGLFYYNDYGSIAATQAQGILGAAQAVVTRTRGKAEPSSPPGSSGRKLYTLAVNANDGAKPQVLYYESNKAKDRRYLNLLHTLRGVARSEGSVLPLRAPFEAPPASK